MHLTVVDVCDAEPILSVIHESGQQDLSVTMPVTSAASARLIDHANRGSFLTVTVDGGSYRVSSTDVVISAAQVSGDVLWLGFNSPSWQWV